MKRKGSFYWVILMPKIEEKKKEDNMQRKW